MIRSGPGQDLSCVNQRGVKFGRDSVGAKIYYTGQELDLMWHDLVPHHVRTHPVPTSRTIMLMKFDVGLHSTFIQRFRSVSLGDVFIL